MEKNDLSPRPKCVVIGGSAGSLKVLLQLLPDLDRKLSFPLIIVLHRKYDRRSSLEQLLGDRTALPVKEAEDKELMQPATIYTAPPDYHLLIEKDFSLSLDASEKVLWSRPSIDVTFQSAAEVFRQNTLGILLSGANHDGAYGLGCIQQAGGRTMIQDPEHAEIEIMPLAALELLQPDYLLPDRDMAAVINRF